jgi:hypothetical protein
MPAETDPVVNARTVESDPVVTPSAPITAAAESLPSSSSVADDPTESIPDRSFELYTHCGINGAMIDGVWWQASPELSDGSHNPPDGWGNPYQPGQLHFVDDTTATFIGESQTGEQLVATFRRTSSTEYPFVCR